MRKEILKNCIRSRWNIVNWIKEGCFAVLIMRKIQYLSPTSYRIWKNDRDDFYLRYLAENRPEREKQNMPMALGSAVDAFIKNYLFESVFGRGSSGYEKFELGKIFNDQVEEQNRESVYEHAKYVFEQYKSSGALGDLFLEIQRGSGLRMEFELGGVVTGMIGNNMISVPLLGKPDVSFINEEGAHIILDFKVNGYYSKWNTTPMPGYVRMRGAGKTDYGGHKNAVIMKVNGMRINVKETLDQLKKEWAEQLSIYSWLTGSPIGNDDFIVGIDQIICNNGTGMLPSIKVAEHRLKVNSNFQRILFADLVETWNIVSSDWIFRDIPRDDSIERCQLLEQRVTVDNDFLNDLFS